MARFLSSSELSLPLITQRVSILLYDYESTVIIARSGLQAIRYLGWRQLW